MNRCASSSVAVALARSCAISRGRARSAARHRASTAECPARQRLAGIPFALAEVQQAARGKRSRSRWISLRRERALVGPERGGVPFRLVDVVDGDERRFAAHRQPHVALGEFRPRLDPARRSPSIRPRCTGCVTRGVSWMRVDAHRERELGSHASAMPVIGAAPLGCGAQRKRNVALARQQARRGIEADPTRAGQVDLGPGVQVGEILVGAGRPSSAATSGLSWMR